MTYGSRCRAAATGPYLAGARPAGRRAGRGMSWAAAGARAAVLAPWRRWRPPGPLGTVVSSRCGLRPFLGMRRASVLRERTRPGRSVATVGSWSGA